MSIRKGEYGPRLRHGKYKTPEYHAWREMRARCRTVTHHAFHNYGGRGIQVCARWRESFENFIADMGPRPSRRHTLDRINNDGNYEPINCRWATYSQQRQNNRQKLHRLTIGSETKTVMDWAKFPSAAGAATIRSRLRRGWDARSAVFSPPDIGKRTPLHKRVDVELLEVAIKNATRGE